MSLRTIPRWQDADPEALRGQTVVVIDVLRWSTVVITALAHGAERVEAFATPEEVLQRADALGRGQVVLGGERGNLALPGFDLGNSPREYTPERVRGRAVLTSTTNGTQALHAARTAREVLIGAFVNLPALVARLREGVREGRGITLLAAGQAGDPAHEDLACAGAIAEAMLVPEAHGVDTVTRDAMRRWRTDDRRPLRSFARAPHAAALRAGGFGADLDAAAAVGVYDLVPCATTLGNVATVSA